MLVIEQQPNVLLPQEYKPTQWIIRNTEILVQEGIAPVMQFIFSAGSGANGQEITLLGETFTSDSTSAYTASTWNYSVASIGQVAANFGNMLRASGVFNGWSITIYPGIGTNWRVSAQRGEVGVLSPFDNTVSLTPSVDFSGYAGQDQVRSTDRFWYQFWQDNTPISEQKFAAFDQLGRVRIDAEPQARKILGVTDPYLLWSASRYDERMSRDIYLRFGTYGQDESCNTVFNQAYETPEITVINTLYQHEILLGFRPFSSQYTLPVRWMTTRPNTRMICRETYEWTAIYLQKTALFPAGYWKITYNYYNSSDELITYKEELIFSREDGVYHVPTGPANPVHPSGAISNAAYYTIEVEVRADDLEFVPYSQTMTITLNSCNCWAAEVYFLEDAGSWRTVVFEKIEERRIEMSAVEWIGPVQTNQYGSTPDGIRLYQDGGKESFADDVDSVFVLATERITERNRKGYEDMLRSSRHIILTASDVLPAATRRIILERGAYGVYRRGESTRLLIPFRFNTQQRVR